MQYVLGLFLGSIPFISLPWESPVLFQYHTMLYILLSLILYYGYLSIRKKVVALSVHGMFPALIYLLVFCVSGFFSFDSTQSIFGSGVSIYTMVVSCILFVIWLTTAKTITAGDIQKVLVSYVSVATLIQLYVLIGYVFSFDWFINPFGTLVSTSVYAGLSFFAAIFLYGKKVHAPMAIFSATISLFVLLLTNWYVLPGISFSLIVFVCVALYMCLVNVQKSIYVLALFFIIQALSPWISDSLSNSLQIKDTLVQVEVGESVRVAERVFAESFRTMLFGTGPNTYTYAWHRFKSTELPGSVNITKYWDYDFTEAGSVVLTQVTTMGLMGLLFWLYILLLVVSFVKKSIVMKDIDGLYLSLTQSILAVVLLFSSVSLGMYVLFFIVTAVLYTRFGNLFAVPNRSVSLKFAPIIITMFLIDVFVKELYIYIGAKKVDSALSELYAYTHQGAGELLTAEGRVENALLYSDMPEYRRLLATLQLAQVNLEKDTASTSVSILREAEGVLKPVLNTSINFRDWMLVGRVYEYQTLLGSTTSAPFAYQAYTAASLLAPTHPDPQYALTLVHIYGGNIEVAKQSVKNVLMLKPNYSEALLLYRELHGTNTNILGNMGI